MSQLSLCVFYIYTSNSFHNTYHKEKLSPSPDLSKEYLPYPILMDSKKEGVASAPTSPESRRTRSNGKGKNIAEAAPPSVAVVSTKATPLPRGGWRKGVAILDFILRLGAIASAIGAAAVMGNNEQMLPFFTQFFQFHVQWDDFPMFQ